jgi:hypothetical protein
MSEGIDRGFGHLADDGSVSHPSGESRRVRVAVEDPREPGTPPEMMSAVTSAQFVDALRALSSRLSEAQRAMLAGHAQAANRTASMEQIARFGNYVSYEASNSQYGRLGGLVATQLGVQGLENKTQALAVAAGQPDEVGHFCWRLRESLAEALEELGWVEAPSEASPLHAAAEADIDTDPSCAGIPETTRQALINARIGQGGFRRRMLALWESRCSVTGCDIDEVLVASHAKAWKDSSNEERLDEYNGLLLSASLDRLFDRGLISFSDDRALLVKSGISGEALAKLGLSHDSALRTLHPRHRPYLNAHRERFGFPDNRDNRTVQRKDA